MNDVRNRIKNWVAAEIAKVTPAELRLIKWVSALTATLILLNRLLLALADWAS